MISEATKDRIYGRRTKAVKKFEFNQTVAQVFDDMVVRSVPFYHEVNQLQLQILQKLYLPSSTIYDLGCSTGTSMILFSQALKGKHGAIIGCDNSEAMLKKAREKLLQYQVKKTKLVCSNLEDVELQDCGVVLMNYTLQFIPPQKRLKLVKKIYQGLRPGGILFLSEKITGADKEIEKLQVDLYYQMKKDNGYTQLEISQKREALDKVLIPWTQKQQMKLLKQGGFKSVDVLFKWCNFASFVGIKT